tara:strand:+ start:3992 stop:5209 length:1218 start_codon:yes stop_codon:yes gene_type:complete
MSSELNNSLESKPFKDRRGISEDYWSMSSVSRNVIDQDKLKGEGFQKEIKKHESMINDKLGEIKEGQSKIDRVKGSEKYKLGEGLKKKEGDDLNIKPPVIDQQQLKEHSLIKDALKDEDRKVQRDTIEIHHLMEGINELTKAYNEHQTIDLFQCISIERSLREDPSLIKNEKFKEIITPCTDNLTEVYLNTLYTVPYDIILPNNSHSISSMINSFPRDLFNDYSKDVLFYILGDILGLMKLNNYEDMNELEDINHSGGFKKMTRFELLSNYYRWAQEDNKVILDHIRSPLRNKVIIYGNNGDGKTELIRTIDLFRSIIKERKTVPQRSSGPQNVEINYDKDISSERIENMVRYFILSLMGLDEKENYIRKLMEKIDFLNRKGYPKDKVNIYEDILENVILLGTEW